MVVSHSVGARHGPLLDATRLQTARMSRRSLDFRGVWAGGDAKSTMIISVAAAQAPVIRIQPILAALFCC